MWLRDTGILNKLKGGFLSRGGHAPLPRVRHGQPLILRQLGIIMIVLVVGLGVGSVVFAAELYTGGPRNRKSN